MASLTQRMIGAAKLDVQTYEEVEADQTATGQAMLVVILTSLAAGVGSFTLIGWRGAVVTTLAAVFGWFIWAFLTYLVGVKMMPEPQTEADVGQLLRTIGFSSSPGILRVFGVVPVIGPLVGLVTSIWMLVAMVIAVRQALDYTSTGRAIVVCLIGWVVYIVATFTVTAIFGGLAVLGGTLTGG